MISPVKWLGVPFSRDAFILHSPHKKATFKSRKILARPREAFYNSAMADNPNIALRTVSYAEAFSVWLRVALLSFGGPAAQIAVMHRILIEEKKWVSENRFLHALNYCMLLPGPEAQQLATYIGWLLHGTRGGLTAGILFVLPGFISILALSLLYALHHGIPAVGAAFFGLKAAVLAVVAEAVIRVGKKALKNKVMYVLAAAAFLSLFVFNLPFPLIILGAGTIGYFGGKFREDLFCVIKPHQTKKGHEEFVTDTMAAKKKPSFAQSLRVLALWLAIWWIPIAGLFLYLGKNHVLTQEALFFSKAAMVTFGGAYSVLSYIAQQAVDHYGWLQPSEMLTGLGMAETTPGPLIQVVQYVGFMGAYRDPAPFSPLTAAFFGSLITTWVTYAPCFLWIFLGAPYIEHLRNRKNLTAALSAITAAVVGVILNLAVWFSLHTLFHEVKELSYGILRLPVPNLQTLDPGAFLIAAASAVLLFRLHWNIFKTLSFSIAAGIFLQWISG